MVKSSTAEKHNYICPVCGDELGQDISDKGYVRHMTNPKYQFEQGENVPTTPST